jgi:hypothetical protein
VIAPLRRPVAWLSEHRHREQTECRADADAYAASGQHGALETDTVHWKRIMSPLASGTWTGAGLPDLT